MEIQVCLLLRLIEKYKTCFGYEFLSLKILILLLQEKYLHSHYNFKIEVLYYLNQIMTSTQKICFVSMLLWKFVF